MHYKKTQRYWNEFCAASVTAASKENL